MIRRPTLAAIALLGALHAIACRPAPSSSPAPRPASQNPSPMVESTRVHERLAPRDLGGTNATFTGPHDKPVTVWIPEAARTRQWHHVIIHFMGAAWLPQRAVADLADGSVAVVVHLGAGSSIYDRSFTDPAAFDSLLAGIAGAVASATGREATPGRITLTAFSAGHGAIRAILRTPRHFDRVGGVLLLDGMHTSYVPERTVLSDGGSLDPRNLSEFTRFAQAAVRGEKRMLVTHSEIFPGTFASTTETADHLIAALGLRRTAVLEWGPRGMQQLSRVRAGGFELFGYAGNSAPDHVDHFHAMPELLARLLR